MFDHPTLAAMAAWLAPQLAVQDGDIHGGTTASEALVPLAHLPLVGMPQTGAAAAATVVSGVSCQFPALAAGGTGLPGLWHSASTGVDLQSAIPLSKWDMEGCFDPDLNSAAASGGSIYTRFAAVLGGVGVAAFDPAAFRCGCAWVALAGKAWCVVAD